MQIATISIPNALDQDPLDATALLPSFARKDEASWAQNVLPEVARVTGVYTRRPADKSTGLVKHSTRITRPTLKSIVTDPSGPYEPTPVVDYVTVTEINVWVHPRATLAEREAGLASAAVAATSSSFIAMLTDTVTNGNSLY